MAFQLTLLEAQKYLKFAVAGETTQAHLLELADSLRAACDEHDKFSVLLDCAGMTGQVTLGELYKVSEYYGKVLSDVELAAINMPGHWEYNDLSEDVVFIRGGTLRHFASQADAEAWFDSK